MSKGGSTQTIQKADPWEGQQPYLKGLYGQAANLPQQEYFPYSTVVPQAPETQAALGLQTTRAMQGTGLSGAGQNLLGQTLGGGYLNSMPQFPTPGYGAAFGGEGGFVQQPPRGGGTATKQAQQLARQGLRPTPEQWEAYSAAEDQIFQDAGWQPGQPIPEQLRGVSGRQAQQFARQGLGPTGQPLPGGMPPGAAGGAAGGAAAGSWGGPASPPQPYNAPGEQTPDTSGSAENFLYSPSFNQAFDAAQRRITPQVQGQFAAGGRYGSGLSRVAETQALGDAFAGLYNQERGRQAQLFGQQRALEAGNWNQERNRQMQALGQEMGWVPQQAALDYRDIGALSEVGAQREAFGREQLADQVARWQFAQQQPYTQLGTQSSVIQGGFPGGTQTTQQPYFRNPLSSALGGAMGGYGLAAGLGMTPAWPFALLGGAMGLFGS